MIDLMPAESSQGREERAETRKRRQQRSIGQGESLWPRKLCVTRPRRRRGGRIIQASDSLKVEGQGER